MKDPLIQQALDALVEIQFVFGGLSKGERINAAIEALRARLAEKEPEPVAWVDVTDAYEGPYEFHGSKYLSEGRHLLYTAPPTTEGIAEASSLLQWAVDRWTQEVKNRPLTNVHRRTLDDTWRQVIRFAGANPDELVGPSHDAMIQARGEK